MTGLVLKLKPNEKFLVNGVVMQNGERSAKIRVRSSNVSILRSRDAMRQEDADTPLKRIYYVAQLAMAGEADPSNAADEIEQRLKQLTDIFPGALSEAMHAAQCYTKDRKFFAVMRTVKQMFSFEASLLSADSSQCRINP